MRRRASSSAFTQLPPATAQKTGTETAAQIQDSFCGAADVARTLPDADAQKLMHAAGQAFMQGSHLAGHVADDPAAAVPGA